MRVNGSFLWKFDSQYVLKYTPFIRARGSRGSNFSAPAKRHTSEKRVVQLPAPGRPTALLSAFLLSCMLQCAGLRCAQAIAPRIKITPPFAPRKRPVQLARTRCSRNKNIDVPAPCHCERIILTWTSLRAEVVMLFAVERLSERSEDWPTNNSYWILR